VTTNRAFNAALGENGRRFYDRHYAWPVIERKYADMLARLSRETDAAARPLRPLPGWIARRRRTLPPAQQVVDGLPRGPVLVDDADPQPPVTGGESSRVRPAPRPVPVRTGQAPPGGGRMARPVNRPGSEQAASDLRARGARQQGSAPRGPQTPAAAAGNGGAQGRRRDGVREPGGRHGRHRRPPRRQG
jgi:hypothetical protein